ncbi:hypothetical protein [Streptomyces beihaiensis]|uniref:Uncharacterized protein n=1 Tax=Streptomyces beihaiensis TaxID=2984495 RepID=A0ABT3U4F1_9ACTN|nr:hypothetical protein [Streptomyces beihaiensis]MCX3064208.1 hypothetical protein [Streptomyces beihaiensis]
MKIRMKAEVSGARNGRPWPRRGGIVDVSDAEGADLCASGIAEPVADAAGDVETAIPATDAEQRQPPEREPRPEQSGPLTTDTAPARKTPARKTAAKKTAAPAGD